MKNQRIETGKRRIGMVLLGFCVCFSAFGAGQREDSLRFTATENGAAITGRNGSSRDDERFAGYGYRRFDVQK